MRFSSPSSSSSREEGRGSSDHQPSPRRLLRKKHKKLDAICEKEYKRNHLDLNNHGRDQEDDESAIRRSSRVRRAPVLLDVSPPPPKKRRKKSNGKDSKSPPSAAARDSEVWRSRLRTRGEDSSPRGKRKVFFDDEVDGDSGVEKYTVVKSKRPGRVKATNGVKGESFPMEDVESRQDNDLGGDETLLVETEDPKDDSEEALENRAEPSENESDFMVIEQREKPSETQNDVTVTVNDQPEKLLETQEDVTVIEQPEKPLENRKDVSVIEQPEKPLETQMDATVIEQPEKPVETQTDVMVTEQPEKAVETQADVKAKSAKLDEECRVKGSEAKDENTLRRPRIKEGRRCGLCGGGTDGKPPKPSARDNNTGESDNEVYSGSSGPDEPSFYDIWDGFGDEPSWLGRLLGPLNDRYGIAGTWVHQHCAVWSPEVYFAGFGCLKNVRAALYRGRALKCSRCGRPGATIGCRVDRCPKTYHLPCARASGCIFNHRKFLIACTDHRHLFQPQGHKLLARIKKIKARKVKLEFRKLANEASRKDIEAEEKWFENCGEDEEFLKRESKRLQRDLARIAPVYIGGKNSDDSGQKIPEGWESIAGLQDVIRCMKEVVILPLLYPEFFDNLSLTPPRGVLLHGYPGTGKTLVVRALIGACSRGDKRIAYFARKGADCLGKYVGDAERQLRLLFQVAEKSQPSIIFFDEIDGLAPRRTGRQDQTHSSVVSTLLALMDGLKSRGSVVVVGATNRPDAVDPALRRPGRFDREIYFPLPSAQDRAAILSLHTRKWPCQVAGAVLERVARETAGFAGADLQALCTQAAMIGLKRNFPLQEILTVAAKEEERDSGGKKKRLPLPSFAVEERDWLEALSQSPPPCSRREAGAAAADVASSPLPGHLAPCLLRPLSDLLVSLQLDERVSLPSPLSSAAGAVKTVMVSALAKRKKKNKNSKVESDRWWSFLDDFISGEDGVAREIEKGFRDSGILLGDCYSCINASGDLNEDMVDKDPYMKHNGVNLLKLRNKSGFRVLIAGSPGSGQRHLASCLVHCFVGNSEIRKVDLATISQEGHGDSVHGITEILSKCAGISSSVVFMPRIDLWAMETHQQVIESDSLEKDSSNIKHIRVTENENIGEKDVTYRASSAWSLFVEHVESICVSSSLTILATSEVPFTVLPSEIKDFFAKRTSKDAQPILVEHTIPRFIVELDTDFDRDSVIKTSAAKLSRDVVQQLIQSIHSLSHVPKTPFEQYQASDFVENPMTVQGSNDKKHQEEESVPKTLAPPNFRDAKVKSNLNRAISSFGYQILRYPHFAELCWATSKLMDGPSAEVSGPWKRWPFNSCVISPSNSLETVAIGSNSVNVKSKEKPGLVRGLIAVGLSAYKGIYTSLREVSVEVRKVLELLVLLIDEKVRAGKDRYRYFQILSQVAFLEDKVNTWAYSLQSLEPASPMDIESSKPHSDNASNKDTGSEVAEETLQRLGDEKAVFVDLNKENGDFCQLNNQTHSKPSSSDVFGGHSNGVSRVEDGLGDVSERNLSTQIPDSDDKAKEPNFLRTEATEDLCLYSCCSECLNTLFDLMKKVLIHRLGSDHTSLTVDRVHDVVASLSVVLIRRVTKLCCDGITPINCLRDSSENGTVATSSGCKCCSNKSHKSMEFAMKFLIRNGALVLIDGGRDFSSLHCRFESLCLCSLIDSILTMNQVSES